MFRRLMTWLFRPPQPPDRAKYRELVQRVALGQQMSQREIRRRLRACGFSAEQLLRDVCDELESMRSSHIVR